MSSSLSKQIIKKFSMSYSEATRLGITDNDLKYITELAPNQFRTSVPNPVGKRKTKVHHSLLDAIKQKYEFLEEIEKETKEFELKKITLKEAKGQITKYNTVADAIDVYLKERYKDYERGLIQITTYEQDVFDSKGNFFCKYGLPNEIIKNIDEEYAQNYVDWLRSLKNSKGKKLSENTIYKPFSFVNKVFNYFANDLEIIDKNPFLKVKGKPHAISEDKKYLTIEEIHYIKEKLEFESIRLRTLVNLILDSGFRKEEGIAIKYGDVNNFRKTIKIERALVKSKIDNRYIIKPVKRKASEREIICTNYCIELINKIKQFKQDCGFVITDDDFVFTAWDSLDILDPDTHSREFTKFLKKINLETIIPLKNLRHSHATYFVSTGANIKAVQKRIGHADITTTLGIYAQTNMSEDKKLVNQYENEFYNKSGFTISELYQITSNRFNDEKRLINFMEKITNTLVDDSNYEMILDEIQNQLKDKFPIFNKLLLIDSSLNDDDIEILLKEYENVYKSIKLDDIYIEKKINL